MTDLETAVAGLEGHTLSLCRNGECLFSDLRGIAPMMAFLSAGTDLTGYSAADLVVGKAAAMLFVKAGVREVFAKTLSVGGKRFLTDNGVPVSYETLTDRIINREGTGVCPMEQAVADTEDAEEGHRLLCAKLKQMKTSSV